MNFSEGRGLSLVGRSSELEGLSRHLSEAESGRGKAVLLLGEPGIGKSTLVGEFTRLAETGKTLVLRGSAREADVRPFGAFSEALAPVTGGELFQEEEYTSFLSIFLVSETGMLMAKSTAEMDTMDADIFAGMLSAVQNFVRDSFDSGGKAESGLGKLVYGDMTIFLEHGPGTFLTAVVRGKEHADMKAVLARAAKTLDERFGAAMAGWTGNVGELADVREFIDVLAKSRFLVKRDLEGLKFENERNRVAERTARKLAESSAERPVLLLIEDLHWADDSSMFLFSYLARNIRGDRVLMMATSRPSELSAFSKYRGALVEEEALEELVLGGLDKAGIRSLIGQIFSPNEFPEEFFERMAGDSQGNPFFIRETLRQLEAENNIKMERGAYYLVREDYDFPKSVDEVVVRRLESLEPGDMAVAEYASCIGMNFSAEEVKSLPAIGEAETALKHLSREGIIEIAGAKARFSHAMFQHTLYSGISERWKSVYHRRLGEHYELVCGNDQEPMIYELARHFMNCGEHGKAFAYCVRAGEKAEGSYDAGLAMKFFGNAASLMQHLKDRAEWQEAEILEKLADSQRRSGLVSHSLENYQKALDLAGGNQDARFGILLKIELCHVIMNETEKSFELLESNMKFADWVKPELASVFLAHAAQVSAARGDRAAAVGRIDRALRKLEEVRDGGTRANVYGILGRVYDSVGPDSTALEMYRAAVAEAEKTDSPRALAQAYSGLGMYLHYRGEHLAATGLFEKSIAYREKLGDIVEVTHSLVSLGMAYSDCSEPEKSLASLKRALALNRKIGARLSMATILGNIGYTLMTMGRHEESLQYQEESLGIRKKLKSPGGMGWSYYDMAAVHIEAGNWDEARECAGNAIPLFAEAGDAIGLTFAKYTMAKVQRSMGNRDAATILYREALGMAREREVLQEQFHSLMALAELGDVNPDEVIPEMEKLAEKIGSPEIRMNLLDFRGMAALDRGDMLSAERLLREALDIGSSVKGIDAEMAIAEVMLSMAKLCMAKGDLEGARRNAGAAAQSFRSRGRLDKARKTEEFTESLLGR